MSDKKKDTAKVAKKADAKTVPKKPVDTALKVEDRPPKVQGANTPEKNARTVMLFGCPMDATEDSLLAQFPSAEETRIVKGKHFKGAVTLCFKTKAEAEMFARKGSVEIGGKSVGVTMYGVIESPDQKARRLSDTVAKKVYVSGLPASATESDLVKAFPAAETARLHRGDRAGQAVVIFPTAAGAKAAVGRPVEVKGVKVTPIAGSQFKPTVPKNPKPPAKKPRTTSN